MSNKSSIIKHCIHYVQTGYTFLYPNAPQRYADIVGEIGHNVLGMIARSDAPYHDLDHTIQVVLVGQEILQGKQRAEGGITPAAWLNFIVALICHDVGFCRGACRDDQLYERRYTTGLPHRRITLNAGATDASLSAFHVDRGKLFVTEQFRHHGWLDVTQVNHCIERTRFPVSTPANAPRSESLDLAGLARAADLIGQLADPCYLNKLNDLFQEFRETGTHRAMGYHQPEELRANYPRFYWNTVSQYVVHGVRYLELSPQGQSILANLYGNVATVEAEQANRRTGITPHPPAGSDFLRMLRSRISLPIMGIS